MGILESLVQAVEDGEDEDALALAEQAMAEKMEPLTVVDALTDAIREVGDRFERMEVFLPEMMLAAKAMQKALEPVGPYLEQLKEQRPPKGTVVIGTAEGDMHDIGKNLVKMMLESNGYDVRDLGVDVSADAFAAEAKAAKANIVATSALLTTTMTVIPDTSKALETAGVRSKVKMMIGGAPITRQYADEIGVEGYADDCASAVDEADRLIKLAV